MGQNGSERFNFSIQVLIRASSVSLLAFNNVEKDQSVVTAVFVETFTSLSSVHWQSHQQYNLKFPNKLNLLMALWSAN